jgi:zinc D-Ala-D-Ala carboxypeptidase
MPAPIDRLINYPRFELWPAPHVHSRWLQRARELSGAQWLLRDKHDGRFLAVLRREDRTWHRVPLVRNLDPCAPRSPTLPAARTATALRRDQASLQRRFGLPDDYASRTGLPLVPEPVSLDFAGHDRYRRPLWLHSDAARAWRRMQAAALSDGLRIEAISGYRSWEYQAGILQRKLERGQTLAQILAVNAAPGFSEHHSGRAIDVSTPGEPAAAESFERTPAFAWLQVEAAGFGFRLSYPRGNPHGVVYEPWHWYWAG